MISTATIRWLSSVYLGLASACLYSPALPADDQSTGIGTGTTTESLASSDPGSTSIVPTTGASTEDLSTGVAVTSGGDSDTSGDEDTSAAPVAPVAPVAPTLMLNFGQTKQFHFTWSAASDAEYYQLKERPRPDAAYSQLGDDIVDVSSLSWTMPLHFRSEAAYVLRACNTAGCADSAPVAVADSLTSAVGYFKASNTDSLDRFGSSVALSADGHTLAVSAPGEGGNGSNESNNAMGASGAVYVFSRTGANWSNTAYLKASNPGSNDNFGLSLSLSEDGRVLVVGAPYEDGPDESLKNSGAAYVFTLGPEKWDEVAYLRAPDAGTHDNFGSTVALSGNGQRLAIGADYKDSGKGAVYVFGGGDGWPLEKALEVSGPSVTPRFGGSIALTFEGDAIAVGAPQEDSIADNSGAAYVFTRVDSVWSQVAQLKHPAAGLDDNFGWSVALSGAGERLAVGARKETVYIFDRGADWFEAPKLSLVQSPDGDLNDRFGSQVALSHEGDTLVVGALEEDGASIGINGDPSDDSMSAAGAVYVFSGEELALESYVKASNPGLSDHFGYSVAVSGDGETLAVGALYESGAAVGVNPGQDSRSAEDAGAVYVY